MPHDSTDRPGLHPDAAGAVLSPARLGALKSTGLVDTDPEPEFDRLTSLSARATGAPVSLVALIEGDRSFFKSAHGLPEMPPGRSVPLSHSLCQHVVATGEPLVAHDLAADPALRDNGAVTDMGARAYLGVPLRGPGGDVLGTVCAVDLEAREWTDDDVATLLATAAAAQGEVALRAEREARAAAERMGRLKSAFLSNMSHELRTPLTAILGSAEVLHDEVGDEARDLTGLILSGGRRLMGTLDTVLDLAQIEAGEAAPRPRPTDIAELVSGAVGAARPLAEQKGLAVVVEVPAGLSATVDGALLERALADLLDNAVKFTDEGAVRVRAWKDGPPEGPPSLVVEVADTGVGIGRGHLAHIFDAFQQVSDGDARTHEGNGLGLALVRRVVEVVGGEVTVESVEGRGSAFRVRVPAPPASESV